MSAQKRGIRAIADSTLPRSLRHGTTIEADCGTFCACRNERANRDQGEQPPHRDLEVFRLSDGLVATGGVTVAAGTGKRFGVG